MLWFFIEKAKEMPNKIGCAGTTATKIEGRNKKKVKADSNTWSPLSSSSDKIDKVIKSNHNDHVVIQYHL